MNKEKLQKIFTKNKLWEIKTIKKSNIWFSNDVYFINDDYIVKFYNWEIDETIWKEWILNFEKELYFYNLFKNKIPVPNVIFSDKWQNIFEKPYIIYPKIRWDNLYSKWHVLNNPERKEIIKRLCNYLKIINNEDLKEFARKFKFDTSISWKNKINSDINKSLSKLKSENILSNDLIKSIKIFVRKNINSLDKQKLALVYFDPHFDNIIIKDNKIVALLDFERTEIA